MGASRNGTSRDAVMTKHEIAAVMRFLISRVRFGLAFALLFLAMPAVSHADSMDDAIARGALRIGIAEETFLPWVGRDASGQIMGFDVDVALDLARVLAVEPQFVEFPFDDLLHHLSIGDVDVVISGLSVTAERARSVLFSIPYGDTDYWLVVDKDTLPPSADQGDYDVEGYKVGAMEGSLAETEAKRLFKKAEIIPLADEAAARDALEKRELNAIVVPTPYPTFMMLRAPERFLLGSDALFGTNQAVAVRPDALRFVNFINAWINENDANGRLQDARDYWFGSLDWMKRVDGEDEISDEATPEAAPAQTK